MGTFRVFISAVSKELETYRVAVSHAFAGTSVDVTVQEGFPPASSGTLLEFLRDQIERCDAVICLNGERTGGFPLPKELAAIGSVRAFETYKAETGQDKASYTQWELLFAQEFGKSVHLFFVDADFTPDNENDEDGDRTAAQRDYRDWLKNHGLKWATFRSPQQAADAVIKSQLAALVRERTGGEMRRRPNNLLYTSIGPLFKGRDDSLADLRTKLSGGVTAIVGGQTTVVHGLGGVGKTRLAIEYAWANASRYSALLFVPADEKVSLANLCDSAVLNLPEHAASAESDRHDAALRWLESHPGWLLVIDNADTRAAAGAIQALLPHLTQGHVLITGRFANWGPQIKRSELNLLAESDAVDFLMARTEIGRVPAPDEPAHARELANELGLHALALEQAAAHIVTARLSLESYLARWRKNTQRAMDWFDPNQTNYPRSVAVTWATSVAALTDAGRRLLYRLVWFAPDPIPSSLLVVPIAGEIADMEEALSNLAAHSLIKWADDGQAFTVHRLVQEVTRTSFAAGEARRVALNGALQWIDAAFVGDSTDVRTWAVLRPLAPHVQNVARFADQDGISEPTGRLMNAAGLLLRTEARFEEAEPLYRRALAIAEKSLGPEHPKVAAYIGNLAGLLQATNRLAEAEPLFRRALAIDEKSLGPDHPEVATDLNNLAGLLRATNRLADAESLYRRALTIEKSFGAEHTKFSICLNNLASLLQATNRPAEAEPLFRRALLIDEKSLGIDHLKVAIRLNNLASLLQDTNRLAEAEPLVRRALAITEKSLGPEHPNVATTLTNLAGLLQATNRIAEAEPLYRRALAIDEKFLGPEHPDVATNLGNLAGLLQATNRILEAEPLYRRALAIDEKSLGADHPGVATDLNNLADLLRATNRFPEAEPLFRRALSIDEKSLGPDHPEVATDLNNLARLLQDMNRHAEAEPLFRRALAIDEKSLGPDHPNVGIRLNNLACLLQDTNRPAEAEPLSRRQLTIFLRFMTRTGHEHPHLRAAFANHLSLLIALGKSKMEIDAALDALAREHGVRLSTKSN